jgi:hypothetical protein
MRKRDQLREKLDALAAAAGKWFLSSASGAPCGMLLIANDYRLRYVLPASL